MNKIEALPSFNSKFIITFYLFCVLLLITGLVSFKLINNSFAIGAILIAIPITLNISFNLRVVFYLLITTMFIYLYVFRLSTAVLFSFGYLFSFLLTFRHLTKEDFANPISKYLIIYFLGSLPSLWNNTLHGVQYLMFLNVTNFVIVLFITIVFQYKKDITRDFVIIFILLTVQNSLQVITGALLTHSRIFGLAGIMFVDYVCIGILISTIYLIFGSKKQKLIFSGILVLLALGAFFDQTRNPLITLFITYLILLLYLIIYSDKYRLNRMKLIGVLILSILFVVVSLLLIQSLYPDLTSRITNVSQFKKTFSSEGEAQNSFVSRVLIWDTAIAGFKQHPLIGIGWYSFPYASVHYYTIPDFLYKIYVQGLTPHQTFIAILCETGIIGLAGFLILYFSIIAQVHRTLQANIPDNKKAPFFAVLWTQVYILISMLMTDAWLWGQGAILWAVVLGLMLGINKKYIVKGNSS